jgi:hypothetical protein
MLRMIYDEESMLVADRWSVWFLGRRGLEGSWRRMDKAGGLCIAAAAPPGVWAAGRRGRRVGLVRGGVIAVGEAAFSRAIEGAEDDTARTVDLVKIGFCADDALVGIAAAGGTPMCGRQRLRALLGRARHRAYLQRPTPSPRTRT